MALFTGIQTALLAFAGDANLLLIRHGRTHMNEHLAKPGCGWGAQGFVDPGLFDTDLTDTGEQQALTLNQLLRRDDAKVDVLIASPLRRALSTADIAFAGLQVDQRRVTPLAAERCYLSIDVGSPVTELATCYPRWDLSSLSDRWWYDDERWQECEWRPPGSYLNAGEPDEPFYNRMEDLIAFMKAQGAGGGDLTVALVCHWGVLHALTGESFDNCQRVWTRLTALPKQPYILE